MLENESQDFQEAFLLVQEYLDDIGYKDIETTGPDEQGTYRIEISRNESTKFVIRADPGIRPFVVSTSYHLTSDLASQLSEGDVNELVDRENISEDETKEQRAAKNIINSLSKEDNEEILFRLTEAGLNVYSGTYTTSKGNIDGFYLFDSIFPYEDDFSISDLNNTLRRVSSQGKLSTRFLQYAFGIEIGDSENEDDDDQTLLNLRIP